MRLPLYLVDAFASRPFEGNPAAVVPLERWLPDAVLQAMAAEHNLSETAFLVPEPGGGWHLRWFTPTTEVELCGHATLASGFVLVDVTRKYDNWLPSLNVSLDLTRNLVARVFSQQLDRDARPLALSAAELLYH